MTSPRFFDPAPAGVDEDDGTSANLQISSSENLRMEVSQAWDGIGPIDPVAQAQMEALANLRAQWKVRIDAIFEDGDKAANLPVLKAEGPAEGATSPSHDPEHPLKENAMGGDSRTIAERAAASRQTEDWHRIDDALTELNGGRLEALILMELISNELKEDPQAPGYTYRLNDDQTEMLGHAAYLIHCSIGRALQALEAGR